jgi:hypothetical protein
VLGEHQGVATCWQWLVWPRFREIVNLPASELVLCAQVEEVVRTGNLSQLSVRVSGALRPGLIWVEAQQGVVMAVARPLLVLPKGEHTLAAEVGRITSSCRWPCDAEACGIGAEEGAHEPGLGRAAMSGAEQEQDSCDGFIADLGLVVGNAAMEGSDAAAGAWNGADLLPQQQPLVILLKS